MTDNKRPRIDAVIRAIKDGKYDDRIQDIQDAIDTRQDARKEQVAKMVELVYGPDYIVQKPNQQGPLPIPDFNHSLTTTQELSQFEVQPGQIPQVQDPTTQEEDGGEYLSTGAQIGGAPGQQQFDILEGRK